MKWLLGSKCLAFANPADLSYVVFAEGEPRKGHLDYPMTHVGSKEQPSFERAREQYALHHDVDKALVTEMLEESPEGLDGWACVGLDVKARGPIGAAMYRQFEKQPAARETYKWLSDDLKLRFRQTWALQRNFEFISKKRIRSISVVTSNQELGSWKNELQLEHYYGGVGIPEAKRQASNYIKNCQKWPDSVSKLGFQSRFWLSSV